ncbi:hypothetical protein D9M70_539250 [compost metagenome]
MTESKAGDLQLDVVLVGPEPGLGFVRVLAAGEDCRNGLGLVDGVLHRFQPDAQVLPGKHGTIAHSEDRRVGSSPEGIDDDAAGGFEAGIMRQAVIGSDTDPDNDDVDRQSRPIGKFRCGHPAAFADETIEPGPLADIYAAGVVNIAHQAGCRR